MFLSRYSAHIDRYIYQYYAFLINEKYNDYVKEKGIDDVAIAYRINLQKNNIHFSKEAFDFIKKFDHCCVMIGDFKDFFGSLNHEYLKDRLCELLQCNRLEKDYYAVYKNITRYSYWTLESLCKLNNLPFTKEGVKKFNTLEKAIPIADFHKYKADYLIKHVDECKNKGIPQGSAISAVLANVYMIDFDYKINEYVKRVNGKYMRYSDDFIIIVPCDKDEFVKHYKSITDAIHELKSIILEEKKTQLFYYENNKIENTIPFYIPGQSVGKNVINFLGFTFDGKNVSIRDKTLSKYYYRMYKKTKNICKNNFTTKKNNRISCKNLYGLYSIKGCYNKDNKRKHGNFIRYAILANEIFDSEENISKVVKRHMKKIRHGLNGKGSSKNDV